MAYGPGQQMLGLRTGREQRDAAQGLTDRGVRAEALRVDAGAGGELGVRPSASSSLPRTHGASGSTMALG